MLTQADAAVVPAGLVVPKAHSLHFSMVFPGEKRPIPHWPQVFWSSLPAGQNETAASIVAMPYEAQPAQFRPSVLTPTKAMGCNLLDHCPRCLFVGSHLHIQAIKTRIVAFRQGDTQQQKRHGSRQAGQHKG